MSHPSYSDPDWMQKFLHNAAKYFENRPTDGEDTAYWANTYNAEKCRKIADEIEKLRAENERLTNNARSDARLLAAYHKWCDMHGCAPSSSDLSKARAALEEKK